MTLPSLAGSVVLPLTLSGLAIASTGIDGVLSILDPDNPDTVRSGEVIYGEQCASCHGRDLEGQPNWRSRDSAGYLPAPPHDASGHTWHHADDLLFEITKYGPGKATGDDTYTTLMPAFEDRLTDVEIVAVLSYIKHQWTDQARDWQNEVNHTQRQRGLDDEEMSWFQKLIDAILK